MTEAETESIPVAPSPSASPTLGERSQTRQNNIDFLRFFFATLVILSHSFLLMGTLYEPLKPLTRGQMYFAEVAVNGFFVLSGFLIAASWERTETVGAYLLKRVLRIYPGFLVAVLLCAFVVGPLGADSVPAYFHALRWPSVLLKALMLNKVDYLPPTFLHVPAPGEVNGSLWTIKIEFECYLLIVALGLAKLFKRPLWVVAMTVGCYALFVLQTYGWLGFDHRLTGISSQIRLGLYFFMGIIFYLYRERILLTRPLLVSALVLLALSSAITGLPVILPIAGVYALFYWAFSASSRLRNFARYGDFSYGLYLYAWPVQQLLVLRYHNVLNPWTLFFAAFCVTLALAIASWYVVEAPCLRLKPRRRDSGTMESAAASTPTP